MAPPGKRSHSYMKRSGRQKIFVSEDPSSPGDNFCRLLCPEAEVSRGTETHRHENWRAPNSKNDEVVFRILCPVQKIAGIIGKVQRLEAEVGIRINVCSPLAQSREGLIFIFSAERRADTINPAEKGLLDVQTEIADLGVDEDAVITSRLLVSPNEVGFLGSTIEKIERMTGVNIRILGKDDLPACALPTDKVLQIVGYKRNVKDALVKVTKRLRHSLYHEMALETGVGNLTPQNRLAISAASGVQRAAHRDKIWLAPDSNDDRYEKWRAPDSKNDELVFRILCPVQKIGDVIGKVQRLEADVGVRINVCSPVAGSQERIVFIFSVECRNDNLNPAEKALLDVIANLGPDEDGFITSRLLVSPNEVGSLGSIIEKIKRSTGANIWILGKDDLPACALPTDKVVQIVGCKRNAEEALVQVTKRLRYSLHYEKELEASVGNSTPHNRLIHSAASGAGGSVSSFGKISPPGYWTRQKKGRRGLEDNDQTGLSYDEYIVHEARQETHEEYKQYSHLQERPPQLSFIEAKQLLYLCIIEEYEGKPFYSTKGDLAHGHDFTRYVEWSPKVYVQFQDISEEEIASKTLFVDRIDTVQVLALVKNLQRSELCTLVPHTHKGDKASLLIKHQVDSIYTTDKGIFHLIFYRRGRYEFDLLWVFGRGEGEKYKGILARYVKYYGVYIDCWRRRAPFKMPGKTEEEFEIYVRYLRSKVQQQG